MKRKCGTCKFFEHRGVANSGTCQHSQRRELRDVVLVRQTELACRNTWDQDLWEPGQDLLAENGQSPADAHDLDEMFDTPSRRIWNGDEVFRGPEDVPMLSPYGEEPDRVTNVQSPVTGRRDSVQPRPGVFAPQDEEATWRARPSVLAAHEEAERARRQALQDQQAARLDDIERRMAADDAVGPRHVPGAGRQATEDDGSFGRTLATRPPEPSGGTLRSASAAAPRLQGQVRVEGPTPESVSQGTEPLPTDEVRRELGYAVAGQLQDEPVVHVDGGVYAGQHKLGRRLPVVQELPSPDSSDPLDREEQLRSVKRCCGTCRDFRQVGDGTRGQCVNPYAFSERRMVQSDQLACRSSLGMWWMPSDDIWLERADTTHHGRPTPLLDAALRVERAGHGGRDSRTW